MEDREKSKEQLLKELSKMPAHVDLVGLWFVFGWNDNGEPSVEFHRHCLWRNGTHKWVGRLLDAAGYPRPAGGGPRFKLPFKTSSNRFRLAIARVIARQLGRVGIQVQVRSYEWGVFFADLKKGSYQLATLQMTELAELDYHYYFFHSSKRATAAKPNAGGNRFGYASAEVDRLLQQGRTARTRASRRQHYLEVQKLLARDLPIIPLWHEDNLVVLRRDVHGYHLLPNARFDPLLQAVKKR